MTFFQLVKLFGKDPKRAETLISANKKLLHRRSPAIQETLLHYFATEDKLPIVKRLLKLGADVNARNKMNETPLWNAASLNYPDMVKLLLKNGADPLVCDAMGETPLASARRNKSIEAAKILRAFGGRAKRIR